MKEIVLWHQCLGSVVYIVLRQGLIHSVCTHIIEKLRSHLDFTTMAIVKVCSYL